MNNAVLSITKLTNSFIDTQGQQVNYTYIEIEFAPGVFAKLSLKESNLRMMQKYAPDMYQLVMNMPLGQSIVFKEVQPGRQNDGISQIYRNQTDFENEL